MDTKRVEKKYVPTEGERELGRLMDDMTRREQFIATHKETIYNDDALMLYRLPLSVDQMAAVHAGIIKDLQNVSD